jgi:hypothetical protein
MKGSTSAQVRTAASISKAGTLTVWAWHSLSKAKPGPCTPSVHTLAPIDRGTVCGWAAGNLSAGHGTAAGAGIAGVQAQGLRHVNRRFGVHVFVEQGQAEKVQGVVAVGGAGQPVQRVLQAVGQVGAGGGQVGQRQVPAAAVRHQAGVVAGRRRPGRVPLAGPVRVAHPDRRRCPGGARGCALSTSRQTSRCGPPPTRAGSARGCRARQARAQRPFVGGQQRQGAPAAVLQSQRWPGRRGPGSVRPFRPQSLPSTRSMKTHLRCAS